MEKTIRKPASTLIEEKIQELGGWRGKMLAKVREVIHEADPAIVEELRWRGTPTFYHAGIVCTGETYQHAVKMTFAKGAALKDPAGLFNSSLDGAVRRAIDIHEGDRIDEAALKDLIRAAVALNLLSNNKAKPKSRPRRAIRKRPASFSADRPAWCERSLKVMPLAANCRPGQPLAHARGSDSRITQ